MHASARSASRATCRLSEVVIEMNSRVSEATMIRKTIDRFLRVIIYPLFVSALAVLPLRTEAQTASTAPLIQANNLTYIGSFTVPSGTLGSTWGFSAAGTWGLEHTGSPTIPRTIRCSSVVIRMNKELLK